MNKVDLVYDTFVHREDSYARQWYDENKGHGYAPVRTGQCTHTPRHKLKRECSDVSLVPISKSNVHDHLRGVQTIGVYQLGEYDTVKWLCFDIDINKSVPDSVSIEELRDRVQAHTLALATSIVDLKGRNTFLVEDTGNKGYHIWVFFADPVPATHAAAVGNWININVTSLPGIHVEVFPKQVQTSKFGNLVKMPLGIHKKTNKRCLFVSSSFEPLDNQWKVLEEVTRWTQEDLETIIDENNIETSTLMLGEYASSDTNKAFHCMQRIIHEGLHEGSRDAGMFRLSLYLKHNHLDPDSALAVANIVNERSAPPMTDEEVQMKVMSAYQGTYSPYPCSDVLLNSFCSSKCRFFESKVQEHWTRYGKEREKAIGIISRD